MNLCNAYKLYGLYKHPLTDIHNTCPILIYVKRQLRPNPKKMYALAQLGPLAQPDPLGPPGQPGPLAPQVQPGLELETPDPLEQLPQRVPRGSAQPVPRASQVQPDPPAPQETLARPDQPATSEQPQVRLAPLENRRPVQQVPLATRVLPDPLDRLDRLAQPDPPAQ